jgi:hypothetical protein
LPLNARRPFDHQIVSLVGLLENFVDVELAWPVELTRRRVEIIDIFEVVVVIVIYYRLQINCLWCLLVRCLVLHWDGQFLRFSGGFCCSNWNRELK